MKNYNDWAQLVAKSLQGEADLIAAIEKDELDDDAARRTFISVVLRPFLPENFGIGSGRVVDAFGNYSNPLDIIIYNLEFPKLELQSTQSVYLYESVLAAFEIRGKLLRKTMHEAMDNCASLAMLQPNISKPIHDALAKKKGLTITSSGDYHHNEPLRTQRFALIGRPPTFIYGFGGIKNSYKQLSESIEAWLGHRHEKAQTTNMKHLPAVIATQGCFAWRNAAPLALTANKMLGLGTDSAPIRLIILQLMHLLNRRLSHTVDSYGFKQTLDAYIKQIDPPVFDSAVGRFTGQASGTAVKKPPASPGPATSGLAKAVTQQAAKRSPPAVAKAAPAVAKVSVNETLQPQKPPQNDEPAKASADSDFAQASFSKPRKPLVPAESPETESTVNANSSPGRSKMKTLDSGVPSISASTESTPDVFEPEFIDDPFAETEEDNPAPPDSSALSGEPDFPKLEDPDANPDNNFEQTLVLGNSTPDVDSKHPSTFSPQPVNATAAKQPASVADKADADAPEFEQTLVLNSPPVQEDSSKALPASTADTIAARSAETTEAPEPFPHLAPENPEEVEPFTSTIPQ